MIPKSTSRIFLLLAVVLLGFVRAQCDAAGPRIGFLTPGTLESSAPVLAGLREGLRENGYVEGSNVAIESRFASGHFESLPELARQLIGLPVDVLVTFATQASIDAKNNTTMIPIVMVGVSDPVASGLVTSLSHPGGNVTGTSTLFLEASGKRLQLLMEITPGLRQVAILWNPSNRVFQMQLIQETEVAARQLGIQLRLFEATDSKSIDAAFAAISKEQVSGVEVLPDPTFAAQSARIAALAAKARLPSVMGNSVYAEAGGLMTYGPNFPELARVAGAYAAKILRGAKPGELAVDQPTKFELVVNMKTANQIGVTIPQSLLLRADQVIQ